MDYKEGVVTVNAKQDYHNCEMVFSMYYDSDVFSVDRDQKYKIHTTVKELRVLNEALSLYQKPGFKDKYLQYTSVQDGSNSYPEFVIDYIDSVELTKSLQALAQDEDSLVQLSEYCLETPPTYEDDFRINKKIESVTIAGKTHIVDDFDDLEAYLESLEEEQPKLFA